MSKLLEADLKSLTLNELIARRAINEQSLIMSELTLDNFSRRVDLAFSYGNRLTAIEIKSEADSLYRLEGQIDVYQRYFDKVIVVADSKFIPVISNNLTKDVGIWEVKDGKIRILRKGILRKDISSQNLIKLLDVTDLARLASQTKIKCEKNRASLEEALLLVSKNSIRNAVIDSLERKFRYATNKFKEKTLNKPIENDDVLILSRFLQQRQLSEQHKKQSKLFWDNLDHHVSILKDYAEDFHSEINQPNRHQYLDSLRKHHSKVECEDVY